MTSLGCCDLAAPSFACIPGMVGIRQLYWWVYRDLQAHIEIWME